MGDRRLARRRLLVATACAAAVVVLSGCTGTPNATVTVSGKSLSVYASQPPGGGGQEARDVLDGEQLALTQAGGLAGRYRVRLVTIDGPELSDNARTAIEDQSAIAYLGELVPGTSAVSVPITNEEDLLEVSPVDTADYLTRASGVVEGSPGKFYPSSKTYGRTFARVVPTSDQEAQAIAQAIESLRVSRLYVAGDGQPYGQSLAGAVAAAARSGLQVSSGPASERAFRRSGAQAMFLGTSSTGVAAKLLAAVSSSSPAAKLFAPSALYSSSFVASLPAAAQRNLYVSSPGFLAADLTPAGRKFVSDFKHAYGRLPGPTAIFGYEAMSALLGVIREAGASANARRAIVQDFRGIRNRASALGTYSLSGGDTNLAPFVIARVQGGALVPFKFLQIQG